MRLLRREFLGRGIALATAPALAQVPAPARRPAFDLAAAVASTEAATGGRIGLAVDDLAAGRCFRHRGDERFPMASTFKALLVAAVLQRIDRGRDRLDRLDRAIAITAADILPNSPVSQTHVGATASVAELCEAAMIHSDNAAANLLLPAVGGPAGLTAWLRRSGDAFTRLDRIEPMMSEGTPGDPRDTTTPAAMAATLRRLLTGAVLSPASRDRLVGWSAGCSPTPPAIPGCVPACRRAGASATRPAPAAMAASTLSPSSGLTRRAAPAGPR